MSGRMQQLEMGLPSPDQDQASRFTLATALAIGTGVLAAAGGGLVARAQSAFGGSAKVGPAAVECNAATGHYDTILCRPPQKAVDYCATQEIQYNKPSKLIGRYVSMPGASDKYTYSFKVGKGIPSCKTAANERISSWAEATTPSGETKRIGKAVTVTTNNPYNIQRSLAVPDAICDLPDMAGSTIDTVVKTSLLSKAGWPRASANVATHISHSKPQELCPPTPLSTTPAFPAPISAQPAA